MRRNHTGRSPCRAGTLPNFSESFPDWTPKAKEMAAEAKILTGSKLEQLVIRIQRHTGRPKDTCWRFVIQYGIKNKPEYRRWTDPEFDLVREELVKGTVEQVAKKLNRTPKAIRNMLRRNHLSLRDIRCDLFSVESLATVLRVRKSEIVHWIEQGWRLSKASQRPNTRQSTLSKSVNDLRLRQFGARLLASGSHANSGPIRCWIAG